MRILQLGKFYPPHRGGMESALQESCRSLVAAGHEVEAMVAHDRPWGRVDVVDGVDVRRLATLGSLRGLPICPAWPAALRQACERLEPDRIHLHLPNPGGALAWLTAGPKDVPLVVSFHSEIVRQRWLLRLWSPLRQRVLERAELILTSSPALRDQSPSLQPLHDRCEVLPLGVDAGWFEYAPASAVAAWHRRLGPRFALFVGRLVYYKGLEVLLHALEGTNVPLAVVGTGPMAAQWRAERDRLGLNQQVYFLGEVEEDSLRALYHASSFLVLPSTAPSEAFGLVQLEAMASGKPVVASRASGGMVSVHEDGQTGLLVPPSNTAALREAVLRLWEDDGESKRMGANAHRHVRENFDRDQLAVRYLDLLTTASP